MRVTHKIKQKVISQIPWNTGHIFQARMPPCDINCPMATSRKNIGTPPTTTQMRYGNKKAPTKQIKTIVRWY